MQLFCLFHNILFPQDRNEILDYPSCHLLVLLKYGCDPSFALVRFLLGGKRQEERHPFVINSGIPARAGKADC